jgi:hypothetical protein
MTDISETFQAQNLNSKTQNKRNNGCYLSINIVVAEI